MLQPLIELFSGEAYRPDVFNRATPMRQRMAGRNILVASFNQDSVRLGVAIFDKKGAHKIDDVRLVPYDLGKPAENFPGQALTDLAKKHRSTEVVVGIGGAWFAGVQESGYDGESVQRNRILHENPEEILGTNLPREMLFAVVGHPRAPGRQSALFNLPKAPVEEIVALLEGKYGLSVCRVQNGCFALLDTVVGRHYDAALQGSDLLVVDHSGVALLCEASGIWTQLGFVSAFESRNHEAVEQAVQDQLARRTDNSKPLTYVNTLPIDIEGAINRATGANNFTRLLPDLQAADLHVLAADPGEEIVGIDLNPNPREARPHIKPIFRYVSYGLVLAGVGLGALGFLAYKKNVRIKAETASLKAETTVFASEAKEIAGKRAAIQASEQRAERLGQWILVALNMQPTTVLAFDSIPGEVVVERFSILQSEGTGQLQIDLVMKGKSDLCYNAIDEMVRKLGAMGFTLNSQSAPVTDGQIHFVGKFLYPPLHEIRWPAKAVATEGSTTL